MEQMGSTAETWESPLFKKSRSIKTDMNRKQLTLIITAGYSGNVVASKLLDLIEEEFQTSEYPGLVQVIAVDEERWMESERLLETVELAPFNKFHDWKMLQSPFFKSFVPESYDWRYEWSRLDGKIRLYLPKKTETAADEFERIIEQLLKEKWACYKSLPVKIFVVADISERTGSGIFMDLAAIAKRACGMGRYGITVSGFIMLPDTVEEFAETEETRQRMYANGYAALKELEAYMSIRDDPEREEIIWSRDPRKNSKIDRYYPLFDFPILVSGSYEEVVSVIVEFLIEEIRAHGNGMRSFMGCYEWSRRGIRSLRAVSENGILKPGVCPEDSHSYIGVGYSYAEIPKRVVVSNIVGHIGEKLFETEKEMKDQQRLKQIMEKLWGLDGREEKCESIDEKNLWRKIEKQVWKTVDFLEYEEVLSMEEEKKEQIIEAGKEKMEHWFSDMYYNFWERIEEIFIEFGSEAIGQLSNDMEEFSIRKNLKVANDMFSGIVKITSADSESLSQQGLLMGHLSEETEKWGKAKICAAQTDILQEIVRWILKDDGGCWKNFCNKVIRGVEACSRFSNALQELTAYYVSLGASLDEDTFEAFSGEQTTEAGVNICQDQETYDWIKTIIRRKIDSVCIQELKHALFEDFRCHAEWHGADWREIRQRYDEIMSRTCGLGRYEEYDGRLSLKISDYFNFQLAKISGMDAVEREKKVYQILEKMLDRLREKCQLRLKTKTEQSYGIVNDKISIPRELIDGWAGWFGIRYCVEAYCRRKRVFWTANNTDVIGYYRLSIANPLCGLTELSKWECAYDKSNPEMLHLN